MVSPKAVTPIERVALRCLEDMVYEEVCARGEPLRAAEMHGLNSFAGAAAAAAVRELLSDSKRLVYLDRKWHLVAWHRLRRRTHEGALRAHLEWGGKPFSLDTLAREFSRAFGHTPQHFLPLLERLTRGSADMYLTLGDDQVALKEWFLSPPRDLNAPYEDLVSLAETDVLDTLHDTLGEKLAPRDGDWGAYLDTLCQAWGGPIPNRVLQYLMWQHTPEAFDPTESFLHLQANSALLLLSGCLWVGPEMTREARAALLRLIRESAAAPAEEEEAIDLAEILDPAKDAGSRAVLTEEETAELLDTVAQASTSVALDSLVGQLFELSPRHDDFRPVAFTIMERLDAEPGLQRVGPWRWVKSKNIPAQILSVPRGVELEEIVVISAEGEDLDFAVSDEGLEEDLLAFVGDPVHEDYGEDPPVLQQEPPRDRIRCLLPYHHHEAGTYYVRALDRGLLPAQPRIYQALAYYQGQRQYDLWLNNETNLLFGLGDFFQEYCPPSGTVFSLAGGEREGELIMEYDGERDPASAIEEERLVELLDLRKKAAQAEWAVFDILQELMRQHQKGIGVNLLHAETSVVRRTPRRVLASLLGSYHCFHQKKEGGAWYFDERKISQGVKKAKRKYIIR